MGGFIGDLTYATPRIPITGSTCLPPPRTADQGNRSAESIALTIPKEPIRGKRCPAIYFEMNNGDRVINDETGTELSDASVRTRIRTSMHRVAQAGIAPTRAGSFRNDCAGHRRHSAAWAVVHTSDRPAGSVDRQQTSCVAATSRLEQKTDDILCIGNLRHAVQPGQTP